MKSNQYIVLFFLLAAGIFSSCEEDESAGVSRLTYYPVITLNGDDELFVETGENYDEQGGTATEEGAEIPLAISYTGTYFTGNVSEINTAVADQYTATYSAINKDGFAGSKTRTVFVAGNSDLVTGIEGLYTATVVRDGVSAAQYTDMKYVIISKTGANTYELSDGIGGYYDLGRAYGPGYAALGATITADDIPANDFTFGPAFAVGAFGGNATITSMDVDPVAKTIHFVTEWDGGPYTFDVTLKQVEF